MATAELIFRVDKTELRAVEEQLDRVIAKAKAAGVSLPIDMVEACEPGKSVPAPEIEMVYGS